MPHAIYIVAHYNSEILYYNITSSTSSLCRFRIMRFNHFVKGEGKKKKKKIRFYYQWAKGKNVAFISQTYNVHEKKVINRLFSSIYLLRGRVFLILSLLCVHVRLFVAESISGTHTRMINTPLQINGYHTSYYCIHSFLSEF